MKRPRCPWCRRKGTLSVLETPHGRYLWCTWHVDTTTWCGWFGPLLEPDGET